MKSHSKPSKDIFLAPCPQRPARLYPQEQAPQQWRSCGDSYEHTWMADYGRNIVALRLRDRQKLARSMGYCPHSRCQLDNLTAHSGSSSSGAGAGSCPAGLCYTKVESGALSFGACCYDSSGIFNSGELFGVYNRLQQIAPRSHCIAHICDIDSNDFYPCGRSSAAPGRRPHPSPSISTHE